VELRILVEASNHFQNDFQPLLQLPRHPSPQFVPTPALSISILYSSGTSSKTHLPTTPTLSIVPFFPPSHPRTTTSSPSFDKHLYSTSSPPSDRGVEGRGTLRLSTHPCPCTYFLDSPISNPSPPSPIPLLTEPLRSTGVDIEVFKESRYPINDLATFQYFSYSLGRLCRSNFDEGDSNTRGGMEIGDREGIGREIGRSLLSNIWICHPLILSVPSQFAVHIGNVRDYHLVK
jgi:hypothetical protein